VGGGLLKFGTGLVSSVITEIAYSKVIKYGRKAFKAFTGAAALSGPGFLAAAGGYLLSEAVFTLVDIAAEHIEEIRGAADEFIDSVCPPVITGSIVSGSPDVFINGMPAAVAESSLSACSQLGHTPGYAAEGSATVFVNGKPKHRKGDFVTCGAKTAQGSGDVIVGGDTERVLPVASGWAELINEFGGALGAAASMLLGFRRSFFKGPTTRFSRTSVRKGGNKPSEKVASHISCAGSAHPVNLLTGTKMLYGPEDLDFTLPGRLPLVWQRNYRSDNQESSGPCPFGPGWSLPFTECLRVNQPGEHPIILTDEWGRELLFSELAPGESQYNPFGETEVTRLPDGSYRSVEGDEIRKYAPPSGDAPQSLRVTRLEDRNGAWIAVRYAENGLVSQISSDAGWIVECVPHKRRPDRIGLMRWSGRELVAYDYDNAGNMSSVTNRAGEEVRRFWYTCLQTGPFAGLPLMERHRNADGLEVDYAWADYPDHPRVAASRTNTNRSWRATYDVAAGRTETVDHLGRTDSWTWHERWGMLSHTDALGRTASFERNGQGLPVRAVDYAGGVWSQEFDETGNIIKTVDPLGRVTTTAWHALFRKPVREVLPDGSAWEYVYDDRGNPACVTDPGGGKAELCRNALGRVQVFIDAQENVFRYGWNERDLLEQFTDCTGNVTRYS
jgi:YD repeat-containing protein